MQMTFQERLNLSLGEVLEESKTRTPVTKPRCALSKAQIDEHYDEHYLGYLKGLKKAESKLKNVSLNDYDAYRSALLDHSFNYNGVILHEHYFECLGSSEMSEDMLSLIEGTYETRKNFEKHLKAALMSSRGWTILSHDLKNNKLMLSIIDDHDVHAILAHPILVLDTWEHAYYIDCKSDKEKYADLMINDINWKAVEERTLRIADGYSISRTTV